MCTEENGYQSTSIAKLNVFFTHSRSSAVDATFTSSLSSLATLARTQLH
jgi:hypothetical protein